MKTELIEWLDAEIEKIEKIITGHRVNHESCYQNMVLERLWTLEEVKEHIESMDDTPMAVNIEEIKQERYILESEINAKIKVFIEKYEVALDIEHYDTSDYGKDGHYIILHIKV